MAPLIEGSHTGEHVMTEAAGTRSREYITVGPSQAFVPGLILGLIVLGTGVLTASAGAPVSGTGGTPGNGVVGSLSADAKAKVGEWQIVFSEDAADAGTFQVFDPEGKAAKPPSGKVGTAYNGTGGINFTIADGSNDYKAGDYIPITVAASNTTNNGAYVALDLTDDNGAQTVAGVAWDHVVTGVGETKQSVAHVRDCELNGNLLVYPEGADTVAKAAINAELAALGIIVR